MESTRVILLSLLLGMLIVHCLAATESCGLHEVSNPAGKCQRACNACRDCGPCLCKSGYIRATVGTPCISEEECHTMHFKWLHDAKYKNDKNNFFKCE